MAGAQPEETGSTSQPLTAGAASLDVGEDVLRGLVFVTTIRPDGSGVSCSGALIANDLALTAGHCIDSVQGSTTSVSPAFAPSTSVIADAIYKFGGWAGDPAGPDVGLLHLSRPVAVNGATTGFATPLFQGDPSGRTVTVYGASTGTYLKADMEVTEVDGRNLVLGASVDGVTTAQGDSGGPAFIIDGGTAFLAGVTSTTGAPARSASIAGHHGWILAAMAVPLSQGDPVAVATARVEEIRAVPEGELLPSDGDLLTGMGWAQAQRVAQWLCTKRGFVGGAFLPGAAGGPDHYRFGCIGRSGGAFRDATQAEIDGAGADFVDVDAVGWAQAARVADTLCRQAFPGAAGGIFTGFQAAPVGDPGQKMGQVCIFANAGGRYGSYEGLTAGQPADAADWLAARRDASGFCRAVGRFGGFPTGVEDGAAREVACIGPFGVELALGPIIDAALAPGAAPVAELVLPVLSVIYN